MTAEDYGAHLLPQHQALLAASGISVEVATQRKYRSVETKSELERKGFSPAQRNVPGLLIPIYDVRGEFSTYQFRPDEPRIGQNGKPIKYETPAGSHMIIDVPQAIRAQLGNPSIPLVVTEGARKADSAVSNGLCCISISGVWAWRGTNDAGGKVALPDFENIALNERTVLIAFDSDVMEKPPVRQAMIRLRAFLEQRGAIVSMAYLPAGEGGEKVGLDDYFAAGHDVEEFHALATSELRPLQIDQDTEKDAAAALELARPLLESADLWEIITRAIRWGGFAGDVNPVKLLYLALTSRFLVRPLNITIVAASASGKNFVIDQALEFFPESAYYLVKAGSERALIYADADFEHRFVIMQEADSLPMEDGPAASAVRALADDNRMEYLVVERDGETGRFTTRDIVKQGPTGLLTTTTRPLGEQLSTRMLTLSISDTPQQTRDVLRVQAASANGARPAPLDMGPFLALQTWLELAGDREVTIPYAAQIAEAVPSDLVRTRRDFTKLLTASQANAFLFQRQREKDDTGRIIATRDDYEAARELVGETFDAAASGGITATVRSTVAAVAMLSGPEAVPVTHEALSKHLGLHSSTIRRRAAAALRLGYLVNRETRRRQLALLVLGQELPEEITALPSFEDLPPPHTPETDAQVHKSEEDRICVEASGSCADPLSQDAHMNGQEPQGAPPPAPVHKAMLKSPGPVSDTTPTTSDASCALVHPDPGAGAGGVADVDEALVALKEYGSELAGNAGHPRLEFRRGQVIMAGAEAWAKFLQQAPEDQAVAAIAMLETLGG